MLLVEHGIKVVIYRILNGADSKYIEIYGFIFNWSKVLQNN